MIYISDALHQALESHLLVNRDYDPDKNIIGFGFGQKIQNGLQIDENALKVYVIRKISPWNIPRDHHERPINRWIPLRDNISLEDVYNVGFLEQTRRPRDGEIWTDVIESPCELLFHSYRSRNSKIMGGISIGIENETTGTLGYIFRNVSMPRSKTRPKREFYILTAGHVLDNHGKARSVNVCQPGNHDIKIHGLKTADCLVAETVETTEMYMNFSKSGSSRCKADAGIARPIGGDTEALELKIMDCGAVTEIGVAKEGMIVKKVGRTTGLTFGKITDIKASHKIKNPNDHSETTILSDQIMTTAMSQEGDSGAILLDEWNRAIGLLCAGSEDKSIFTPMNVITDALDITLF